MAEEYHKASDNQFARPVTACEAQGTAICHRGGRCSDCVFALAKLNPEKTLYFFLGGFWAELTPDSTEVD